MWRGLEEILMRFKNRGKSERFKRKIKKRDKEEGQKDKFSESFFDKEKRRRKILECQKERMRKSPVERFKRKSFFREASEKILKLCEENNKWKLVVYGGRIFRVKKEYLNNNKQKKVCGDFDWCESVSSQFKNESTKKILSRAFFI